MITICKACESGRIHFHALCVHFSCVFVVCVGVIVVFFLLRFMLLFFFLRVHMCWYVCVSVVRDGPLIEQLSLLAECVYQPDGEHRGQWH